MFIVVCIMNGAAVGTIVVALLLGVNSLLLGEKEGALAVIATGCWGIGMLGVVIVKVGN